jgi:plasmid rolling circle replication initiator protein Rep
LSEDTNKQTTDGQAEKNQQKQKKFRVAEKTLREVFRDIRPDGSEVPWVSKKLRGIPVAESFSRQGDEDRADRMRYCGSCLEFLKMVKAVEDGTADAKTKYKLFRAYLCKDRFCPMCAWRRSLRTLYVLVKCIERVFKIRPKLVPLLLTVSIPSPRATVSDLSRGLDVALEGWKRLMNDRRVKAAVEGWFRSLELTHNVVKDTIHVHIHALLLVPYEKYLHRKLTYIDHTEWLELWRRAARDERITQVDIRRAKDKSGKKSAKGTSLPGYMLELSKYITKDDSFIFEDDELTDRMLSVLSRALRKRRFHSSGGIMKKIAAELALLDEEGDEDLMKVWDGDDSEGWKVVAALLVHWHSEFSSYFVAEEVEIGENQVCLED